MMAPYGSDSRLTKTKSEKMLKPQTKRRYETDLSPEQLSSSETSQQQIWHNLMVANIKWRKYGSVTDSTIRGENREQSFLQR